MICFVGMMIFGLAKPDREQRRKPTSQIIKENEDEMKRNAEAVRVKRESEIKAKQDEIDRMAAERRMLSEMANRQIKAEIDAKAIAFQLKRAEEGSAQAQYDLGIRYLKGDGVEANLDTAKSWLRKASAQGHGMAGKRLETLAK